VPAAGVLVALPQNVGEIRQVSQVPQPRRGRGIRAQTQRRSRPVPLDREVQPANVAGDDRCGHCRGGVCRQGADAQVDVTIGTVGENLIEDGEGLLQRLGLAICLIKLGEPDREIDRVSPERTVVAALRGHLPSRRGSPTRSSGGVALR